jgi:hypothetical protein
MNCRLCFGVKNCLEIFPSVLDTPCIQCVIIFVIGYEISVSAAGTDCQLSGCANSYWHLLVQQELTVSFSDCANSYWHLSVQQELTVSCLLVLTPTDICQCSTRSVTCHPAEAWHTPSQPNALCLTPLLPSAHTPFRRQCGRPWKGEQAGLVIFFWFLSSGFCFFFVCFSFFFWTSVGGLAVRCEWPGSLSLATSFFCFSVATWYVVPFLFEWGWGGGGVQFGAECLKLTGVRHRVVVHGANSFGIAL